MKRPAPAGELMVEGWQLARRLERLSADSHWAHQASGLRGALLRCLAEVEAQPAAETQPAADPQALERLTQLVQQGEGILVKAARLIRTPDTQFD